MNSRLGGSEEALADAWRARASGARAQPRLLIGGLGMGFTLRAALAALGARARSPSPSWCRRSSAWARGPMAAMFGDSLDDPRVSSAKPMSRALIRPARSAFDAILLDVDNGPAGLTRAANDALYDAAGLGAARAALRPGGVLAVWSSGPGRRFHPAAAQSRLRGGGDRGARQRGARRRAACDLDRDPGRARSPIGRRQDPMSALFEELDYRETPIGALSLRRRRELRLGVDVFEIKLGEDFLMSSLFTASEIALARLGLGERLGGHNLDVVVGGLGLGYTAAAVLENAQVGSLVVVEALAPVDRLAQARTGAARCHDHRRRALPPRPWRLLRARRRRGGLRSGRARPPLRRGAGRHRSFARRPARSGPCRLLSARRLASARRQSPPRRRIRPVVERVARRRVHGTARRLLCRGARRAGHVPQSAAGPALHPDRLSGPHAPRETNYPTRTLSIEIEPPSMPSTGKPTASPCCRAAST